MWTKQITLENIAEIDFREIEKMVWGHNRVFKKEVPQEYARIITPVVAVYSDVLNLFYTHQDARKLVLHKDSSEIDKYTFSEVMEHWETIQAVPNVQMIDIVLQSAKGWQGRSRISFRKYNEGYASYWISVRRRSVGIYDCSRFEMRRREGEAIWKPE